MPQGHNFVNGLRVQLSSGGTLPQPFVNNTTYYVVTSNPSSGTFKLSTTKGGTPIDITNAGSGTHTINEMPPDPKLDSLAVWARLESNYQGSGRQPLDFSGLPPIEDVIIGRVYFNPVTVTFTPNTGGITYRYFGCIADGNATPNNSIGRLKYVVDYGAVITIPSGYDMPFSYTTSMSIGV